MVLLLAALAGCARHAESRTSAAPAPVSPASFAPAVPVDLRLLPLDGPVASPEAEISAMCWCGDTLVLMPQHPERFGTADQPLGAFVLSRDEIEQMLDRPFTAQVLRPRRVELRAPGLLDVIDGWDGIEAVASHEGQVYVAVEARQRGRMAGRLLRGQAVPCPDGALRLELDTDHVVTIDVPTDIPNMSQEALVACDSGVAVIFEANGVNVNPAPQVVLYDSRLAPRGTLPLTPLEYRITDACRSDGHGRFWVINYFFPGEGRHLRPPVKPEGPVEQLVELQLADDRVQPTTRAPLNLRHGQSGEARNWEALVRLPDRGFLVMTDRYPTTLLAFVPDPGANP